MTSGFNSFKDQRDNDKLFEGGEKQKESQLPYKDLVREAGQGPLRLDT